MYVRRWRWLTCDIDFIYSFSSCQSNCGNFVNPSKRLLLYGICTNCDQKQQPRIIWSDISPVAKGVMEGSLTGDAQNILVIKDGVLSGGREYTFRYSVTLLSGTFICLHFLFLIPLI